MDSLTSTRVVLETDRLLLRTLSLDDADDLGTIYADPEVMHYYPKTRTRQETRENLAFLIDLQEQHGCSLWATIHKADQRFIGRCGLLPWMIDDVPEVEVAYMLSRPYWGRRLATEAARAIAALGFRHFGRSRLISLIHPDNVPSQRVAEKVGMRHERDIVFHGQPCRVYAVEHSNDSTTAVR